MRMDIRPPIAFAVFLWSAPAAAQAGTAIPEPSSLALFGIGLAGLVIGRQAAKRRASDDD